MPGLSLDSEIHEAFVGLVVAYLQMHVDSDKGCCPAISVSPVLLMYFFDLLNYLLTAMIPDSRFVFQPLVAPARLTPINSQRSFIGLSRDKSLIISNSSPLNEHTPFAHPSSSERHNFFLAVRSRYGV